MSRAKSVRPKPPGLAAVARLAPRYQRGERLADLARECGCWRHDLRRRLSVLTPLRPEDQLPRRCRVCGEPVRSGTRRDLCCIHVRQFCSRCDRRLPKGRVNRWCSLCEQERKPADYELRRQLALRRPGNCAECGIALPAGRINRLCAACWGERERSLRRERRSCAGCGVPIPERCRTYCDACVNRLQQWRRDYHQGDPSARLLRPLEPRRRWQEKAA